MVCLKNIQLLFISFLINSISAQSPLATAIKNALHDVDYILCIDGGGSKTELQVLDKYGQSVALTQHGTQTLAIKASGSNINVVGENGVKRALDGLIANVKIATANIDISSILTRCAIIGGFSGAGRVDTKNTLKNLCKTYGFNENNIVIASDADIALESMQGDGIILIAGTGSICFGKKGNDTIRVGGLGRLIGDEGSGYYIGLHALKAALEDEYGWGQATALKNVLRNYFNVSDLKSVISPFYKGDINNYQIAAIAPLVFNFAEQGDPMALQIINDAIQELGCILENMIRIGKFEPCPIYFFGGLFKSTHADQLMQRVIHAGHCQTWQPYNKAQENPTVMVVQQLQKQGGIESTNQAQKINLQEASINESYFRA